VEHAFALSGYGKLPHDEQVLTACTGSHSHTFFSVADAELLKALGDIGSCNLHRHI